jgi:hypothetical protein
MFLSSPTGLLPCFYVADTCKPRWLQRSETNPPIHNSPFLFQERSVWLGWCFSVWIIPLSLDTHTLWRSITSQTLHPHRQGTLLCPQNSPEVFEVIYKFTRFSYLKLFSLCMSVFDRLSHFLSMAVNIPFHSHTDTKCQVACCSKTRKIKHRSHKSLNYLLNKLKYLV